MCTTTGHSTQFTSVFGMTSWTAADLPSFAGRTVIVTGANSGLGLITARELARVGAKTILAVRNTAKGDDAAASITGEVEVRPLDLQDLASVRAFAEGIEGVDVLVNNAGIMAVPYALTVDGFESQIGTNHLGHFALTNLLLPKLTDRVVTVSSGMHLIGAINLEDLNWKSRSYSPWRAYGQSKLANLLFTSELQRRLAAAGSPLKAHTVHPGYSATNLQGCPAIRSSDRATGCGARPGPPRSAARWPATVRRPPAYGSYPSSSRTLNSRSDLGLSSSCGYSGC
jgi:NAD(P)-dependent dehydrogenase (short-subunit alcohol dehydrogenase family)